MKTTPQTRSLLGTALFFSCISALMMYHFTTNHWTKDKFDSITSIVFGLGLLIIACSYVRKAISLIKISKKFGYESVGEFEGGFAIVKKNGKMFHVKQTDYLSVYEERYDDVDDFRDGVARVKDGDKVFLIDRNGVRQ